MGYEPAGDPLVLANRKQCAPQLSHCRVEFWNGRSMEYSVYISEGKPDDFIRNFCLRPSCRVHMERLRRPRKEKKKNID